MSNSTASQNIPSRITRKITRTLPPINNVPANSSPKPDFSTVTFTDPISSELEAKKTPIKNLRRTPQRNSPSRETQSTIGAGTESEIPALDFPSDGINKDDIQVTINPEYSGENIEISHLYNSRTSPTYSPARPVLTPRPIQKMEYIPRVTHIDNITSEDVENVISRYGYSPLSKIIVEDEGARSGEFIKAMNPVGITVFVRLDNDGYTTVSGDDLTMVRSVRSSSIPYSYKTGSYEQAAPQVPGVAIECKDGVCFVQRSPNTERPIESNYSYPPNIKERQQSGHGSIIEGNYDGIYRDNDLAAYPIVSLKSIIANPAIVLEQTEAASDRLMEMSNANCVGIIEELNRRYVEFSDNIKTLVAIVLDYENALTLTTTELRSYAWEYIQCENLDSESARNYNNVLYNMLARTNMRNIITRSCVGMGDISDSIADLTGKVNTLRNTAEMGLSNVNGVMSIPEGTSYI